MGVDVASFGDYFADKRISVKSRSADRSVLPSNPIEPAQPAVEITLQGVPPVSEPKSSESTRPVIRPKLVRSADEPIKCLVYNDPFASTYKKYIFTADGKYLLGGMMIGDNSDFVKLVAIVKKKVFPFFSPLFYCWIYVIVFSESIGCTTFTIYHRCQKGRERRRRP
jgi:nitrite reductase (NAD(P)H)